MIDTNKSEGKNWVNYSCLYQFKIENICKTIGDVLKSAFYSSCLNNIVIIILLQIFCMNNR